MVAEQFPQVRLVRNQVNAGFAKGNNIGIRHCVGKYLLLVNSDVTVLSGCIPRLLAYMEGNPGVGLSGPKVLNADGTLQHSCYGLPTLWNTLCRALALDSLLPRARLFGGREMRYAAHETIEKVEMLSGCFWLARRTAVEEVGLLDERFFMYGEDIDWCKRFGLAGWEVAYFPLSQAIHYGGASSANAPIRFYLEMQKADMNYWKKHHGRLAVACYAGINFLHHLVRMSGESVASLLKPGARASRTGKFARNSAYLAWRLGLSREGKQHGQL